MGDRFYYDSNLMEILVPKEWYEVLDVLKKEKGTVVLLGAVDTGKTTLGKFLINHLFVRGMTVAFVDADIGQSSIGPPTTLGLVVFESQPKGEKNLPQEIFFVGSTTPEENLSLHLKGVKRMVDRAIACGAEVVLVDTTGLVSGEVGKELKIRKIDLLSPCTVLVLQRCDEIEHILEVIEKYSNVKVYRLPIPEQVRSRSKEERRAYRTKKYLEYFRGSEIKELVIEGIPLEGVVHDSRGQSILLERALTIKGLLIGFKSVNEDTLALGVLKEFLEGERVLRVMTPLRDLRRVQLIHLSSIGLSPLFEEERIE